MDFKSIRPDDAIQHFEELMVKNVNMKKAEHGDLLEFISLGEDYDDPDIVLQALDAQNQLYSFYASMFHKVNEKQEELETGYKLWKAEIETKIRLRIYNSNIDKGMTANNANPTAKEVDNYFLLKYKNNPTFKKWDTLIKKNSDRISKLRIMRDTIDKRGSSLNTISNLLSKCIDKDLIKPNMYSDNPKKKKRGKAINKAEEL